MMMIRTRKTIIRKRTRKTNRARRTDHRVVGLLWPTDRCLCHGFLVTASEVKVANGNLLMLGQTASLSGCDFFFYVASFSVFGAGWETTSYVAEGALTCTIGCASARNGARPD